MQHDGFPNTTRTHQHNGPASLGPHKPIERIEEGAVLHRMEIGVHGIRSPPWILYANTILNLLSTWALQR